jgi:hypothetical protein
MIKRYYLSEMAVSDLHGGGLTMHRVLGDDLDAFDLFFHVDEFATGKKPIVERFAERQVNLHQLFPPPNRQPETARYYADRALVRLGLRTASEWLQRRWARKCADHVMGHVDLDDSLWLVVPQYVAAVRVMNELWRRRPVRYVTWVMDDHVIERGKDGWRYPNGFDAEYAFHLKHAKRVFVISAAMARVYRELFNVEAEVLFGPADPVSAPAYTSPRTVGPLRLCYFGAIRRWQRDALEKLVAHLAVLGATLDLFSLHEPPATLLSSRVSVCASVPPNEVIGRMRDYDGVVIPASFDEDQRNLTELNIATKMSECFASGTIPVVVAPAYAAMVQFAQEHGGALVISDFGDAAQVAAFRAIRNADRRACLLSQARRVAEQVCSTSAMRRTWKAGWQSDGAATSRARPPIQPAGSRSLSACTSLEKAGSGTIGTHRL